MTSRQHPPEMDAARYQRGLETLNAVDAEASAILAADLADIAPDLGHHIVAYGFGDIYARTGLAPQQRQLVTLGMLTALGGCERQLEFHVGASLNVGLSPQEIIEALIHSSVYCGFPRALNAISVARDVFKTRGLLPVQPESHAP